MSFKLSPLVWKYYLAFLSLVTISLLIFYFILVPELRRHQLSQLELDLAQKNFLLEEILKDKTINVQNSQALDALVDEIGEVLSVRVTLIQKDGTVLADSFLDGASLTALDNHATRPEILQAERQGTGTIVRHSTSLGADLIYVTKKTTWGFVRLSIKLDRLEATMGQIRRSFFMATFYALMMAGFIGLVLSKKMTKPIHSLFEHASRMAQGNYAERIAYQGDDEISKLGASINQMATKIELQVEAVSREKKQLSTILESMVEGVLVTNASGQAVLMNGAFCSMLRLDGLLAKKNILECLRNKEILESISTVLQVGQAIERDLVIHHDQQTYFYVMNTAPLLQGTGITGSGITGSVTVLFDLTEIRRLENIRKEFVANVSHELKTPLTNIRGFAETLRQGAREDALVADRFLEKIESNAIQLQNLVEDILHLSKIESGRLELQMEVFALTEAVQRIEADFTERLTHGKLFFKNLVGSDLTVRADRATLDQILRNLIDNAIKCTPEGGSISVSAIGGAEKNISVTVQDSGIGIPSDALSRVFERFYRVDKARSRSMGGTGLGLAIVKHLVGLHGGEVTAQSTPGQGSIFTFTLRDSYLNPP